MVERRLGQKGAIPRTEKRSKSVRLRQRKARLGQECFWTAYDSSDYVDDNVLAGI